MLSINITRDLRHGLNIDIIYTKYNYKHVVNIHYKRTITYNFWVFYNNNNDYGDCIFTKVLIPNNDIFDILEKWQLNIPKKIKEVLQTIMFNCYNRKWKKLRPIMMEFINIATNEKGNFKNIAINLNLIEYNNDCQYIKFSSRTGILNLYIIQEHTLLPYNISKIIALYGFPLYITSEGEENNVKQIQAKRDKANLKKLQKKLQKTTI
jgi:hypothetical protein